MSRPPRRASSSSPRFPRVSGDEPASLLESKLELLFSPRERG